MTHPDDAAALADEMATFLTPRSEGDVWVGDTPDWFGDLVFGGFAVAQATAAACLAGPRDRRIHSLHAYFLRPVVGSSEVSYRVTPLREGRTLTLLRVDASQDGTHVLTMSCSFAADGPGYEYQLPFPDGVGEPDPSRVEAGPGPWVAEYLGPTPPAADGSMHSTHRSWIRVGAPLPDDPALHAAFVAFASDWTGTGGRPLALDADTDGIISLDHGVWFHRALRADEWIHFDVTSTVNTAGRGLLRGTMYTLDGDTAVSVAQELLLRVPG